MSDNENPLPVVCSRMAPMWKSFVEASGQSEALLKAQFRQRFLDTHAAYPECSYPPIFFEPESLRSIMDASRKLLSIVASLPRRLFNMDLQAMLAFQGIDPAHRDFLLSIATPKYLEWATHFCRPDVLLCEDGFKIVEFNISTAIGGLGLCDREAREFTSSPYYEYLRQVGVKVESENMMAVWGNALRQLIGAPKSAEKKPVFFEALADPEELRAPYPFHAEFVRLIAEQGFEVKTGLIQQLEIRDTGVYFDGAPVDLIYSMFTYREVIALDIDRQIFLDLIAADAAKMVDFVMPPVGTLFGNKANLALLTSPEYAHMFSAEERKLIDRHIPLTYVFKRDLLEEAISQQETYVLKPTSDFGGAQVCIGSALSPEQWKEALQAALDGSKIFVLQKLVTNIWNYDETRFTGAPDIWSVCLGPTIFGNQYGGTLLRQSRNRGDTPIINVGHGALAGTAYSVTWEMASHDSDHAGQAVLSHC